MKAVPGSYTLLSQQLLSAKEEGSSDLGSWVKYENNIIPANEIDYEALGLYLMTGGDMIAHLFATMKGTNFAR